MGGAQAKKKTRAERKGLIANLVQLFENMSRRRLSWRLKSTTLKNSNKYIYISQEREDIFRNCKKTSETTS